MWLVSKAMPQHMSVVLAPFSDFSPEHHFWHLQIMQIVKFNNFQYF